jgi:hypothetical protein
MSKVDDAEDIRPHSATAFLPSTFFQSGTFARTEQSLLIGCDLSVRQNSCASDCRVAPIKNLRRKCVCSRPIVAGRTIFDGDFR